jgi:hypothetical protein
VPQWLFAYDAAAIAAFRALALIATHPAAEQQVRAEPAGLDRPMLRACVLESLRLWPTTPGILRDTTTATEWGDATSLPEGTMVLIYAPLFHRDRRLPGADRFEPGIWLDGGSAGDWPLVPFSAGPAACPGRNLVLLTTSLVLAGLLDGRRARLASMPALGPQRPLPGSLDPFTLRFDLSQLSQDWRGQGPFPYTPVDLLRGSGPMRASRLSMSPVSSPNPRSEGSSCRPCNSWSGGAARPPAPRRPLRP